LFSRLVVSIHSHSKFQGLILPREFSVSTSYGADTCERVLEWKLVDMHIQPEMGSSGERGMQGSWGRHRKQ
jgi:hypothetical protein